MVVFQITKQRKNTDAKDNPFKSMSSPNVTVLSCGKLMMASFGEEYKKLDGFCVQILFFKKGAII